MPPKRKTAASDVPSLVPREAKAKRARRTRAGTAGASHAGAATAADDVVESDEGELFGCLTDDLLRQCFAFLDLSAIGRMVSGSTAGARQRKRL